MEDTITAMGQAVSLEYAPQPSLAPSEPLKLPFVTNNARATTVMSIGNIPSDTSALLWHIAGGRKVFPFLPGFRSTCTCYNKSAELLVQYSSSPNQYTEFIVVTDNGQKSYTGGTPTAPFAKMALDSGFMNVINGMEAFGFTDATIQGALKRLGASLLGGQYQGSVIPMQLQKGVPVGDWVRRFQQQSADTMQGNINQSTITTVLLEDLKRFTPSTAAATEATAAAPLAGSAFQQPLGRYTSLYGGIITGSLDPSRMTSAALSLTNWLDLKLPAKQQMAIEAGQLGGLGVATATTREMAPLPPSGLFMPREGGITRVQSLGLPPRPTSLGTAPAPQLQQQASASRGTSRRKGGSMSEAGTTKTPGRNWTSYTVFGSRQRDLVRAEFPAATATQIEQIVGQRWANLKPEEKSEYAKEASAIRRASQEEEGGNELHRTQSDATTALKERQLRPRKKRERFSEAEYILPGEFEEPEEVLNGRKPTSVVVSGAAPVSRKRPPKQPVKKQQKRPLAADEEDVLGLLADMRAEAIASESDIEDVEASGEAGGSHQHVPLQQQQDKQEGQAQGDGSKVKESAEGSEKDLSKSPGAPGNKFGNTDEKTTDLTPLNVTTEFNQEEQVADSQ